MAPSVKDALPFLALPQHFRAFLVKLSLVEAQLNDLPEDGTPFYHPYVLPIVKYILLEDMSFGIFLELKEDAVPSASKGSVCTSPYLVFHSIC